MNKLAHTTAALAALMLVANVAHADGDAPNFGNCQPVGKAGSISLETVTPDTLTVAAVLPSPGWYNGVSPERIADGFEYCMAADVAQRAGLKHLKIMNLAWDQYISGTARGYDIAIAGTTITEPRKKVFDFSQPYFSSNLGIAVKDGSDISENNVREQRIGVLQGNVGSEWVRTVLKPAQQPSVYQSQPDMLTALLAGQVDAIVTDTTLALSATSGTNGRIQVIGQFELDQGYGVITPKGSPNTAAVDSVVGDLKKEGTLDALSKKYLAPLFGVDPNSVPVWQVK
ncbi:ABC transporter substrate-binding protein [Sinorhizobium meliloti]|uniref:ABC transporter substrate-binding protein n=1 Tax=Rhizobium meliloti TaxID=382 RepID=UPI00398D1619